MLPWPIWSMILGCANHWNLRLVCGRFKKIVETGHKFKFTDFAPIVERGTLRILKMYLSQHDYENYDVKYKNLKITNTDIISHLIGIKGGVVYGVIHAIKTNNDELFKFYAQKFNINKCEIIKCAFKYNRFTNFFRTDFHLFEEAAIKGACRGCRYDTFCRFKLPEGIGAKDAFKGGCPRIISTIIKRNKSIRYLLCAAAKVGNIELADKILKKANGEKPFIEMLENACKRGKLKFVKHYAEYLPENEKIIKNLFHFAANSGRVKVVDFLAGYYGETIGLLDIMLGAAAKNRVNVLKKYFPAVVKSKVWESALIMAIHCEKLEVIKYILSEQDFDICGVDNLCYAKKYKICDYLSSRVKLCPRCIDFGHKHKCPIGKIESTFSENGRI